MNSEQEDPTGQAHYSYGTPRPVKVSHMTLFQDSNWCLQIQRLMNSERGDATDEAQETVRTLDVHLFWVNNQEPF